MGRKDLSAVRRDQILNAFEQCILEFGLFSTTLTTVAEKAEMNRGQIHKYIGNRDALLSALIERLIGSYREDFSNYLEDQKESPNPETILKYFFDEWGRVDSDDDAIFDALVAESAFNSDLKEKVLVTYSMLEEGLAVVLHKMYPDTAPERCQNVAYAIISMAYGSSTMTWLGFNRTRIPEIRVLAKTLIQTLQED